MIKHLILNGHSKEKNPFLISNNHSNNYKFEEFVKKILDNERFIFKKRINKVEVNNSLLII